MTSRTTVVYISNKRKRVRIGQIEDFFKLLALATLIIFNLSVIVRSAKK